MGNDSAIQFDEEMIQANVSNNFRILLNRLGITQKKLGMLMDVSESSISDFCNAKKVPTLQLLLKLKRLYKIDIDDFLTGDISMSILDTTEDEATVEKTRRYCGMYYIYYFDSGEIGGADHLSAPQSMKYGIIYIYELRNAVTTSKFRCSAGFDFDSVDEVKEFSNRLSAQHYDVDIEDMLLSDRYGTSANKRAYTGEFVLGKSHAFIDLRHSSTDKALLVFNQCREGENFRGAVAAMTSVSVGSTERPVMQYVGIADTPIYLSEEEIQEHLLLDCPEIICGDEVDPLISLLRDLFTGENPTLSALNDRQAKMLVKACMQDVVNELARNNLRRYSKVDFSDDKQWLSFVEKAKERVNNREYMG